MFDTNRTSKHQRHQKRMNNKNFQKGFANALKIAIFYRNSEFFDENTHKIEKLQANLQDHIIHHKQG